jgi:hypothetical protein
LSETLSDDRKVFEKRLNKALDEAWSKVNKALEPQSVQSGEWEMRIRLAAEAVEYSSALFSLTYGLEDFDPEVEVYRNIDPHALVKESVEELKRARELRQSSTTEAYSSLRAAADHLKIAYLDQVKKTAKKSS